MKSFDKKIKKEFKLLWEMSSEIHLPEPPNTDDAWMEMEQLIEQNEVKTKLSPARFYPKRKFSPQPRFAYVIAAVLMFTLLGQPAYLWLTTESFITDRGEQISFNLPDDSKIRLNAESELTFRSSFNEKSRLVTLSGEAYLMCNQDHILLLFNTKMFLSGLLEHNSMYGQLRMKSKLP
jgi:ferric-dicitrate binding protein FerR (iron transport regulator)